MPPELAALVCALCTSLHFAIIRMRRATAAQCWALTSLNSLGGALACVAILGVTDILMELQQASRLEILLLATSGLLWTLSVYCEFAASAALPQSISAVVGALRLVLLLTAAMVVFGENVTATQLSGAACILLAQVPIRFAISRDEYTALALRLAGMLCGALALMVDKYLTISISWRLVLFSGYLLPGILAPLLGFKQTLRGIIEVRRDIRFIAQTTFLFIIIGSSLIWALANDGIFRVSILLYSSMLFSFLIGVIFFQERQLLTHRIIAMMLVALGIVLVIK